MVSLGALVFLEATLAKVFGGVTGTAGSPGGWAGWTGWVVVVAELVGFASGGMNPEALKMEMSDAFLYNSATFRVSWAIFFTRAGSLC